MRYHCITGKESLEPKGLKSFVFAGEFMRMNQKKAKEAERELFHRTTNEVIKQYDL